MDNANYEDIVAKSPSITVENMIRTINGWIYVLVANRFYMIHDFCTSKTYYLNDTCTVSELAELMNSSNGFEKVKALFSCTEIGASPPLSDTYSSSNYQDYYPSYSDDKSLIKYSRIKNMVTRPVITLCGSSKFKDKFREIETKLCLEGNIVLSMNLFGHADNLNIFDSETKFMLDDIHKQKILMSDEIFVINVDGYIGESTKKEIEWAELFGIPVKYLEETDNE